jgi:hypothetical protein
MLVLFALFAGIAFAQDQKIRIGVVEFEEKNDIGLDSAGTIVAELVVTEIINTGRYQVEERLFLQKVLEEQELMMSGVIDSRQASQIGKVYAIDALVSGSVMRIGSQITVTGRLIQVETGEILKTGSVSTGSLDDLTREVQILANELADIPREAFEIKEDLEARQWRRIEIGVDITGSNNIGYNSGAGLGMVVRYTPPLATLWIEGVPVGAAKNIQLGGVFHVIPVLGIGGAYGIYFDDLMDYVEVSFVHAGILVRPRLDIEAGLFFGGSLSGVVWTTDQGKLEGVDGTWSFPNNFGVWVLYKINDRIAIRGKYLGVALGDFADDVAAWETQTGRSYEYPGGDLEYDGGTFSVGVIYSLVVGR